MIAFATPTVTDVVAKWRYPWNGLVDITCKVSGLSGTANGLRFYVAAVMPDSGSAKRLSHYWIVKDGEKLTDSSVSANGDYRLLWDAKADLGAVRYTNMVVRVTFGGNHDKVQLWEGGPYWATTNIGAEKPEDYGYYFWWGDTVGYKRENGKWVASDGSNSNFSIGEINTPTYGKSDSALRSEGWITSDGVLAPEHDAAHVHWGGDWRMPTDQELDDLCYNKCDWEWTTQNGVNGYVVRGRGEYASNSIFLPCAGYGSGTWLGDSGSFGYYWSSVPFSGISDYSLDLHFYSGGHFTYDNHRGVGESVRPVQAEVIGGEGGGASLFTEDDSVPFLLDTDEPLLTVPITYDSSWVGGRSDAMVIIAHDGEEIKRTTGEGEFDWMPTAAGKHTLTYTTYINGVAQDEVYTATVFKDWKYTVEDGKATIVATTQTSGDVVIPSEIDGYPVVGLQNGLFSECSGLTSITMPNSVTDISGILSGVLEQNDWILMEDESDDDGVVYRSNDIDHDSSTHMTMTVNGPCEFSFDWKVSSEGGWDWLNWYLNGSWQSEISGDQAWQTVTYSLPEGEHTIKWEYSKDGIVDNGSDCGWVRVARTVASLFDGCENLRRVTLPIALKDVVSFEGCPEDLEIVYTEPEPVVISSITYQNLRGATHTNPDSYQEGTLVSFSNPSGVTGYTFTGWTPSQILPSDTGDKVVTANWEWTPQDAVVDASITGWDSVTVKADWVKTELEQKFGIGKKEAFIAKFGDDLTSAMTKKTGKRDIDGNELLVWHDYVAGTDPTDVNSTFKAIIDIQDGKPVISWEPDLNSEGEERVYTVHGKENLSDIWHSPITALDHFFKVDVFLPHDVTVTLNVGDDASVAPISVRFGQPVGELPTPTREGYNFLGWFTASEGGVAVTPETVVTANMTIYARWELQDTRAKVQLWEGGPYWATTNIGAEKPEDYGYYFWWGDTVGYKRENDKWVASDGSNSNFSFGWDTCPTMEKSNSTLQSEGWITADGVLAPEHDAAQTHWGGEWRMPTYQELNDLCYNKCDWEWTTQNGVNGYVVRGRGEYASNSIFLPCAGYGGGASLYNSGFNGFYRSSVPRSDSSRYSWDLYFYSGGHDTGNLSRYDGQSVRPVQGFTK